MLSEYNIKPGGITMKGCKELQYMRPGFFHSPIRSCQSTRLDFVICGKTCSQQLFPTCSKVWQVERQLCKYLISQSSVVWTLWVFVVLWGGSSPPIRVSISYLAPDLIVNSKEAGNNKRIFAWSGCMNMNITICSEDLLNPLMVERTSNVAYKR